VYNEQSVSTSAPTCSGWPRGERIYSRDTLGGTDGGSSGSPVVNASNQVVGQLSGGCGTNVNDPCDSTNNSTVDGAFVLLDLGAADPGAVVGLDGRVDSPSCLPVPVKSRPWSRVRGRGPRHTR
jgi:hypothetical protein